MTIPARHVRRAVALHRFEAIDDVLERLVQRGADMHIAVGERRAIVEDECLLTLGAVFLDRGVEIQFLPVSNSRRLTLDQICPHREFGFWQKEGVFQVLGHTD